jgi:hypothetical protein
MLKKKGLKFDDVNSFAGLARKFSILYVLKWLNPMVEIKTNLKLSEANPDYQ